MNINKHSRKVPKEVLEEAQALLDKLAKLLSPYLLALTPADRRKILKMGAKTQSFVEKAYEYAKENKNLIPPYMNMDDFEIDFADANGLWALYNRSKQLTNGIDDTQTTAGSEAFRTAIVFYNSVKSAAAQDIVGAKAIYEDMRWRFYRASKKKGKEANLSF